MGTKSFGLLTLLVALGGCQKDNDPAPAASASASATAVTPSSPVAAPGPPPPATARSLPQPSPSAHFEYVPGHENWSMPQLRGDKDYKASYTYRMCMKAPPHRPDEAAVCKDINDSCIDNHRSQEACDRDTKDAIDDDPAGLTNLKRNMGT